MDFPYSAVVVAQASFAPFILRNDVLRWKGLGELYQPWIVEMFGYLWWTSTCWDWCQRFFRLVTINALQITAVSFKHGVHKFFSVVIGIRFGSVAFIDYERSRDHIALLQAVPTTKECFNLPKNSIWIFSLPWNSHNFQCSLARLECERSSVFKGDFLLSDSTLNRIWLCSIGSEINLTLRCF